MSCVLHGLTGQINTEHYPKEFKKDDILSSTIHTVAATTSDLRRVYDFEQDPDEIEKIFNNKSTLDSTNSLGSSFEFNNNESFYIPNDDDSDFEDYNDIDLEEDDEEFLDLEENNENHKDKDKDKDKEKKKKKKHKEDKKKKKDKDKDKDGNDDKKKKKDKK